MLHDVAGQTPKGVVVWSMYGIDAIYLKGFVLLVFSI